MSNKFNLGLNWVYIQKHNSFDDNDIIWRLWLTNIMHWHIVLVLDMVQGAHDGLVCTILTCIPHAPCIFSTKRWPEQWKILGDSLDVVWGRSDWWWVLHHNKTPQLDLPGPLQTVCFISFDPCIGNSFVKFTYQNWTRKVAPETWVNRHWVHVWYVF